MNSSKNPTLPFLAEFRDTLVLVTSITVGRVPGFVELLENPINTPYTKVSFVDVAGVLRHTTFVGAVEDFVAEHHMTVRK